MQNQAKQRSKGNRDSFVQEVRQGLGYEHSYTSLGSSQVHGFIIHKADICFQIQAKPEAQLLTNSLDFPEVHQLYQSHGLNICVPSCPKFLC